MGDIKYHALHYKVISFSHQWCQHKTLMLWQKNRQFADGIHRYSFPPMTCFCFAISSKFIETVPMGLTDHDSSLVQVMNWCRTQLINSIKTMCSVKNWNNMPYPWSVKMGSVLQIVVFTMPTRPMKFTRYCLTQWISKLPRSFWNPLSQTALINVILFGTTYKHLKWP